MKSEGKGKTAPTITAIDPPEFINKCLECKKTECTNCLAYSCAESPRTLKTKAKHREIAEKAEALRRQGLRWDDVAGRLGIPSATLSKIRKEFACGA